MDDIFSEAFITQNTKLMLRSIIKKVDNWEDAREIVQECWLKFFVKYEENGYPKEVPYKAILFQLLKFESYNFIKKKVRRRKKLVVDSWLIENEQLGVTRDQKDTKLLFKERKKEIRKHIENNSKKFDLYETMTILESLENRDNTQIAETLNISAEEVAKRKYMAKEKLKHHFEKRRKKKALFRNAKKNRAGSL